MPFSGGTFLFNFWIRGPRILIVSHILKQFCVYKIFKKMLPSLAIAKKNPRVYFQDCRLYGYLARVSVYWCDISAGANDDFEVQFFLNRRSRILNKIIRVHAQVINIVSEKHSKLEKNIN